MALRRFAERALRLAFGILIDDLWHNVSAIATEAVLLRSGNLILLGIL